MTPRHVLFALLLAGSLLLDYHALSWAVRLPFPAGAWFVLLGLALGQTAWLVAWLVGGRGLLARRTLVLLLAVWAWAVVLAAATDSQIADLVRRVVNGSWQPQSGECPAPGTAPEVLVWMTIFTIYLGLLATLLAIGRCVSWGSAVGRQIGARNRRPRQFSIGAILSLTTAAAMVMAVVRQLALPAWLAADVFGFAAAAAVVAALLSRAAQTVRTSAPQGLAVVGLLLLICPLVGFLGGRILAPPLATGYALTVAVQGLTIVAGSVVIRVAGSCAQTTRVGAGTVPTRHGEMA